MTGVGGSRSHRLVFIDVLRGLAVMGMVEAHVVNACLAQVWRHNPLFTLLDMTNGFVAVSFLFCAGAGFWLGLERKGDEYRRRGPAFRRFLGRAGLIILLSYSLHLPAGSLRALLALPDDRLQRIFKSDILHVIGLGLLLALGLALLVRVRRMLIAGFAAAAAAIFLLTPLVHAWDAAAVLPPALAPFFGSPPQVRFSLFPWLGYFFAGAALTAGFLGARNVDDRRRWYLWVGLGTALVAVILKATGFTFFGETRWWISSPGHCLYRTGLVAAGFALLYGLNEWLSRRPLGGVLQRCGQEALFVYYWHLVIVYGTIYNPGLRQLSQARWGPAAVALVTATLIPLMYGTAMMWRDLKLESPRRARWTLATAMVFYVLIFVLRPAG
ncbi:MAG TPA: heparan-alpha-glucosaminide N-acetyltransferase domain-containing protein [Acidobacteriota bacterium]|nr:heparan-alpha-glucosaminide N-acetyltransferase domain-containing protein [Acidobacteriota bacterium]HQF86601.1 heparan-alpha-glucosaminide N-acetyltransferase domain-containing protein [Acidobacteriota bacterium]HQG90147.1 heparan-alpha-glucosaminide N-acetyltransferase domain-containing protein [Acidobacteriota bacterium]HQK88063.1 heparan-alpha-glucosaminide N-acetyltransferase domain-containing protein [Acidobacteriota bacterium]